MILTALLLFAQAPPATPLYDGTWPTHVLSPGHIRVVGDPADLADDINVDTGTKSAMRNFVMMSVPGDVAQFHGQFARSAISSGNPGYSWTAVRPTPIKDIRIVGADMATSVINYIELGSQAGNFNNVSFENFTFDMTAQAGLKGMKHANGGTVKFKRVDAISRPTTKWGWRAEGSFGWVFEDITAFGGGQEHLIYVDNVQGFRAVRVVGGDWKRSLIQLVCRWASSDGFPHTRASSGDVLIRQCDAYDTGEAGAAAFTIAGHPTGSVEITDCWVDSPYDTGVVAAYLDKKQMELADPTNPRQSPIVGPGFLNAESNAIGDLTLTEVGCNLSGTRRNAFAIDSCGSVTVSGGLRPRTRIASEKQLHHFEYRGTGTMGGFGELSLGLLEINSPLDPVGGWNAYRQADLWWRSGAAMTTDEVHAVWNQP